MWLQVNSVIDKKKRLEGELERLKHHLMTVEATYTHEVRLNSNKKVIPE